MRSVFTPQARRDFRRLAPTVQRRIIGALDRSIADQRTGDVQKLAGSSDEWRLRVGDWRVRFLFAEQRATIVVLRVPPRGRAYRA